GIRLPQRTSRTFAVSLSFSSSCFASGSWTISGILNALVLIGKSLLSCPDLAAAVPFRLPTRVQHVARSFHPLSRATTSSKIGLRSLLA
ncbi:uncharacterized protein LAESUDRAFT_671833, partial [Laetiporus sulphureus 93-53]